MGSLMIGAWPLEADHHADVSVEIGRIQGSGHRLEMKDIKDFFSTSIDLDPPVAFVRHPGHGDLILDDAFNGKIYLKGLRVPTYNLTFKYGYQLFKGHINRDRDQVINVRQMADSLTTIWAHAIDQKGTPLLA